MSDLVRAFRCLLWFLVGLLLAAYSVFSHAAIDLPDFPELKRSYVVNVGGGPLLVPSPDCFTVGKYFLPVWAFQNKDKTGFLGDCTVGNPGHIDISHFDTSSGSYTGISTFYWYLDTYTDEVIPRKTFWDQVNGLSLSESASILTAIVLCWVVGWAVRQALRVGTSAND